MDSRTLRWRERYLYRCLDKAAAAKDSLMLFTSSGLVSNCFGSLVRRTVLYDLDPTYFEADTPAVSNGQASLRRQSRQARRLSASRDRPDRPRNAFPLVTKWLSGNTAIGPPRCPICSSASIPMTAKANRSGFRTAAFQLKRAAQRPRWSPLTSWAHPKGRLEHGASFLQPRGL